MTAQAYEERLGQLDATLEDLQRSCVRAVELLGDAGATDESFTARWRETAERLKQLRHRIDPADYDREQLAIVAGALLDIRDELDGDAWDLDACDRLLISLEQIRQVVRDALDEHVGGIADDAGAVLGDLDRWLPDIPDRTIAELVGVDRRTLSRWRRQGGQPRRRLRLLARLVAILRHNWDEEGIIAWFDRARRELGGQRPAALLADPDAEDALIAAARSGRSQYAS